VKAKGLAAIEADIGTLPVEVHSPTTAPTAAATIEDVYDELEIDEADFNEVAEEAHLEAVKADIDKLLDELESATAAPTAAATIKVDDVLEIDEAHIMEEAQEVEAMTLELKEVEDLENATQALEERAKGVRGYGQSSENKSGEERKGQQQK
jgi:hypothetical protein